MTPASSATTRHGFGSGSVERNRPRPSARRTASITRKTELASGCAAINSSTGTPSGRRSATSDRMLVRRERYSDHGDPEFGRETADAGGYNNGMAATGTL